MTALAPASLLASIPSPPFRDLTIGPLSFRLYGLMIALGVLAAVWIGRRRYASYGGDPEDITTIALVAVPAGLVGARLYHVITDFSDKYSDGRWWPDAFMVWKGGLGIPGGVLLGAIAGVVTCKVIKLDWRVVADAAAPAIPVAQAIGRLGNWFNQELYGRPTSLPWGLEIDPEFRPADQLTVTTFHPTFLYELLWNLGLAGFIVWASGRVVLRRGRWLAVYVMGYGLGRLWVEALRADDATTILGLRVNIWTSLIAIVGGALWLLWGGDPVDREATARLRAGESMAAIIGGEGVRGPVAAQLAAEAPDGATSSAATDRPAADEPVGDTDPPVADEPAPDAGPDDPGTGSGAS
jgi:prolipoprotein diacylglyceryl transferase